MIHRVDAQDYEIYIEAPSEVEARRILADRIGHVPESLLTWSIVDRLPDGAELLNPAAEQLD